MNTSMIRWCTGLALAWASLMAQAGILPGPVVTDLRAAVAQAPDEGIPPGAAVPIRGHDLDEAKANEAIARAEEAKRNAKDKQEIAVVEGELAQDRMRLEVELASVPEGLADLLVSALRDVTKLRSEVELVAPGGLPNDGKVIEDAGIRIE